MPNRSRKLSDRNGPPRLSLYEFTGALGGLGKRGQARAYRGLHKFSLQNVIIGLVRDQASEAGTRFDVGANLVALGGFIILPKPVKGIVANA